MIIGIQSISFLIIFIIFIIIIIFIPFLKISFYHFITRISILFLNSNISIKRNMKINNSHINDNILRKNITLFVSYKNNFR